jgi:heptosyltransferase-2
MKVIIRSPNWVGDAVMCLPSIEYLKEKIPASHIAVVAKDWVKEIFLNHPAVDEIISLNKPKNALIKDIRKSNFDTGILFTNSLSSALFFFLAGLKKRIGYKTDLRSLFLTDGIPLPENLDKLHQRDYYFEIVKKMVPGNETPKNPSLYLNSEEIKNADKILGNMGIKEDFKIVGICPGASYGPAKRWQIERFRALAEQLTRNRKVEVLIFGSNKEKELGEIVKQGINNTLNLCGKTTTRELMALIKKCDVFITNDTGPMHIASALDVNVVAIFGPTIPGRTAPLGEATIIKKDVICSPCKHRVCPKKNHDCMEKISVEEVFEVVKKFLKL